MQEEACRHTLSALHTMLRHAVHRALCGPTPLSWASPSSTATHLAAALTQSRPFSSRHKAVATKELNALFCFFYPSVEVYIRMSLSSAND